jgi:hypothetical protein
MDLRPYLDVPNRIELWSRLVADLGVRTMAEVGVYRGAFAQQLLDRCPGIATYYMIDPWRHLADWNKPANKDDDTFEQFYAESLQRTEAHAAKRVVLRGRTVEVADEIPDGSLDFAYVDGDHTLRGITVDLIRMWPKIKPGGWLGGDDFSRSIWQHKAEFEPTLVFPWAVHFAEAVDAPITALPHKQFVIEKSPDGFRFDDPTGVYDDLGLRSAMQSPPARIDRRPLVRKVARRLSR